MYKRIEADVELVCSNNENIEECKADLGRLLNCRSYQVCEPNLNQYRPCTEYIRTIIEGAEQHNLPCGYVSKIKMIVDELN